MATVAAGSGGGGGGVGKLDAAATALLVCDVAGEFVVGPHAVSVVVYGVASSSASAGGAVLTFVCPVGYFGQLGASCVPCPVGGSCDGGDAAPVALTGYYPMAGDGFVRCDPPDACLGGVNATCGQRYTGPRCASCAIGAYR